MHETYVYERHIHTHIYMRACMRYTTCIKYTRVATRSKALKDIKCFTPEEVPMMFDHFRYNNMYSLQVTRQITIRLAVAG